MIGRAIELTALVIVVAYVARNGGNFATVIGALGSAYSQAVSALMSHAG